VCFTAASTARNSRSIIPPSKHVIPVSILVGAKARYLHSTVQSRLQGWLIGAHEFEAHHVFDFWYHNTSNIVPTAITGDMHSVNKANFAIMHWFGPRFEPRFTNLQEQLNQLYCTENLSQCEYFLIRPVGQIDLQAIMDEKNNIDQIVATLGLKVR